MRRLGASTELKALVDAPTARLRASMQRGLAPAPESLAGREFRGALAPRLAALLGRRRFVKGFRTDRAGVMTGYNVLVKGADLDAPWTTTTWRGRREIAFFDVRAVDPDSADNHHLGALLLDYGSFPGTPWAVPTRAVRDYLVQVEPGSDLLLGHAYLAAGKVRLPAGYFVLEPLEQRPDDG